MNYKSMWWQLKQGFETPYASQKKYYTVSEILTYIAEIEEKERWNIEHKKGPPPRCPPNPY